MNSMVFVIIMHRFPHFPSLSFWLLPAALLVAAFPATAWKPASNSAPNPASHLAPTPPMGWNSWDAYGLTINEADFRANTAVVASLRSLGWKYSVIDEGWYMQDPFGANVEKQAFQFDSNGRLIPALNRFPSAANGAGLKPLADSVHAQGLLFGIHLVRGIPRESVRRNTPIADSSFTAAQAGDTTDVCPWDNGNYGVRDNPAGQAWYDSMIALYASWGVDFLKVDCISDHPYKPTEIRQIAAAIRKSGRPIVLSLSPGPTALANAAEVTRYANMWRIADDHWDVWSHIPEPGKGEFPLGTRQAFDRLAAWQPWAGPGHWPDEDMLPFGSLQPHPGWGQPRQSRFTQEEERTEFILWAVARSPLILGANLTQLDDFTRSLITNKTLIAMNQEASVSHPMQALPTSFDDIRIWQSVIPSGPGAGRYLAIFNLRDQPASLTLPWAALGLGRNKIASTDIFTGKRAAANKAGQITLEAHAATVLRIE